MSLGGKTAFPESQTSGADLMSEALKNLRRRIPQHGVSPLPAFVRPIGILFFRPQGFPE